MTVRRRTRSNGEQPGHDLRRALGLLSEEELAAALGLTVKALRNWRAARTGPPYASYTTHLPPLYRVDAVQKWLREREQETQG